ncbi:MAG: restriction endonuclease subunit S [Micavibrio sp.]|nr:restriction endonuclease subunit S [Micavibrio sp.]
MKRVALLEVSEINPSGPKKGVILPDEIVDFAPMATLHEDGYMRNVEKRQYSEVSSGFTPFKNGDLLIAKITPCFENNKIGIASIETEFGFGSTEFHVVRCDSKKILNKYLFFILRHDYIRKLGERRMTGSGGQRRVPLYFIEELEIPLPCLEEQKRIVETLGALDQQRLLHLEAADKSLSLLNLLRDQAFRGEL